MAIKRFCDNPKCGKEIVAGGKLVIPPGELLERHAVEVKFDYAGPDAMFRRVKADFCRACLVSAINRVEGGEAA